MKRCSRCGESKPLDEFHLNRNNRTDGRAGKCKPCCAEYNKEWQLRDPERAKASWSASEKKNRTKYYSQKKATQYGISKEEMELLLATTSCMICGRQFDNPRTRHIDHCHITGRVRGILCTNCNTGIGNLRDSVELLEKAIQYLSAPL